MVRGLLLAAVTGLSTPTFARVNALNILVSNDISPAQPSATVMVWASFEPQYYAFARSIFSCVASPDPGGFSDPRVLLQWDMVPGDISPDGDRVDGASPFQLQDPIGGFYADPSNPIAIWQVTWSTGNFSPRNINIALDVSDFHVYLTNGGDWGDFLDSLQVGSGTIHVIPSPPLLVVLTASVVFVGRRQQR